MHRSDGRARKASRPRGSTWAVVRIAVLGLLVSGLSVVTTAFAPGLGRLPRPACTISAKLVNSCRPWLGVESGNYGTGSGVPGEDAGARGADRPTGRHRARLHRPPVLRCSAADMVTMAKRPATIALINWKPTHQWTAGKRSQRHAWNAQIDKMAASIKALGTTKMMLTIYHEPEGNVLSGGSPRCATQTLNGSSGSTTDYVNMWHNVRERFDALGVDNVVWVMNYTGFVTWHCMTKDLWPGNDYVDWLMWDPYTRNAGWTATVNSFYNYLSANSDAEHDFLSKPWGLGEFGYVGSGQAAGLRDVRRGAGATCRTASTPS